MRNVFELAVRSNEFSPREKTLLGDIAMEMRDWGTATRLRLSECSKISGMAQFYDAENGKILIYVTRHRDHGGGVVRYRISPTGKEGIDTVNFSEVVTVCRDYLRDAYELHPQTAVVISFPFKRFG